jgi:hypothetical protein
MNIVADHLKSLMTLTPVSEYTYRPTPKDSLTYREQKLFWRYHGHFPNDFAKAIVESLPQDHKFISYDHLQNLIYVESL